MKESPAHAKLVSKRRKVITPKLSAKKVRGSVVVSAKHPGRRKTIN